MGFWSIAELAGGNWNERERWSCKSTTGPIIRKWVAKDGRFLPGGLIHGLAVTCFMDPLNKNLIPVCAAPAFLPYPFGYNMTCPTRHRASIPSQLDVAGR